MNLLGITGPAGHGKDAFADALLKHWGGMERYAYADPIKALVHHAFHAPVSWETREGKELEQEFTVSYWQLSDMITDGSLGIEVAKYTDIPDAVASLIDVLETHLRFTTVNMEYVTFKTSWRELYQLVGTEWGRQKIHLDFWINMAPTSHTIITDLRGQGDHPTNKNTEALHVLNNGGIVIEVYDPRKGKSQCKDHSSESGIDAEYITVPVKNNGTLKDLERKAIDVLYTHILKEEI